MVAGIAMLGAPRAGGAADSKAYYTAAQAAAGAKAFAQSCAQCHGAHLQGVSAPALKGASMHGSQSIADIYSFMAQQMPAGNPGSLKPATYAAIMAFILKQNGHPAGNTTLTAQSVKSITEKI
jgi:mono/diheme cytochrome c family protein